MKYLSTREGGTHLVSLSHAIQQGLASDGGLFVPESWPNLEVNASWSGLEFSDFTKKLLIPFFKEDALLPFLDEICAKAFNFPLPLEELDSNTALLELFHGPTHAFKDFGARFLALCLNHIPNPTENPRMVLVATSGDTGGAVASAFAECSNIRVIILYPNGKISQRQEMQLTTWGDTVRAFAVEGNFDDCQRIVKEAFASDGWKRRLQLISANSINIARLFPQMATFAYASFNYHQRHGVRPHVIIPSGNVGNSLSALWAKKLGFPIEKVIFAHNANSTVPDYFKTSQWNPRPSVATLANAMDVGNPSNFERVRHLYPNIEDLKHVAEAYTVSDDQIRGTICDVLTRYQRVVCPHTATALFIRDQLRASDPTSHSIVAATAHPAKFDLVVEPLIQRKIEVPASLDVILRRKPKFEKIDASLDALLWYPLTC